MPGEVIYPGLPPILLRSGESIKYELPRAFSHRFQGTKDGIRYILEVPNSIPNSDLSPSQWTRLSIGENSLFDRQAFVDPGILVRAIHNNPGTPVESLPIKGISR